MLRDVGDPKLVGAISAELTPYAILGSGNVGDAAISRSA
jgi:hypothetical protein